MERGRETRVYVAEREENSGGLIVSWRIGGNLTKPC